jgi:hypothetical protein
MKNLECARLNTFAPRPLEWRWCGLDQPEWDAAPGQIDGER